MSKAEGIRMAVAIAIAASLASGAVSAQPATEADPDWPCIQRKVPSLTPAAVWSGPPIEDVGRAWRQDEEVSRLALDLSQRRLPIEEAEARIRAFAEGLPPEDRQGRLTLLFAGLFDTMNAERGEIMDGIARYARRQRAAAEALREQGSEINDARQREGATAEEQALFWNRRIFDERRRALTYICEMPRLVEQRLFALGRVIAGEMPD
ncbi:hypothetical protein [Lutibaculum baratangense]|uniref:Uncharacterized protein n=1 Tax=Lutibaculum baratangense AMV1 TaxID=631454 RepID=V4RKF1_9HYPH|nr:hypothetical protein [Lutibaculum baratangense]ESR25799.1 hypothetical protein N177_1134 [Lutibaculum baratangense AMV1]